MTKPHKGSRDLPPQDVSGAPEANERGEHSAPEHRDPPQKREELHTEEEAQKSEGTGERTQREGRGEDGRGVVGALHELMGKIINKGESGLKRATDLTIPKELISFGREQMGSLRTDVVGIVGKELQRFLGELNLGQELLKIFTYLTFEVKMQIRLVPSEKGGLELRPKTQVKLVDSKEDEGD